MTVNLSIKGVPSELAARLRLRAERNHRSLQGELMAIVEQAAAQTTQVMGAAPAASMPQHTALNPASTVAPGAGFRRGHKSIEQTASEHRLRFPKPITSGPLAVDIIRADRDGR